MSVGELLSRGQVVKPGAVPMCSESSSERELRGLTAGLGVSPYARLRGKGIRANSWASGSGAGPGGDVPR